MERDGAVFVFSIILVVQLENHQKFSYVFARIFAQGWWSKLSGWKRIKNHSLLVLVGQEIEKAFMSTQDSAKRVSRWEQEIPKLGFEHEQEIYWF